ncbi:MAG TPA: MASE1 domain-containing protein, partial [Magnetospirillum sp.]|nr:MASE1 domain-containing protein [Magnetospirillum sp.]
MISSRLRQAAVAAAFVAAYVALDRVSFIHSINALNITPWNPPPGLGLALLLLAGARVVPLVFAGALAADLAVRGLPGPWWAAVGADASMALVYGVAAALLRRQAHFNPHLPGLRDVFWLLAATVVAAGAAAVAYVGFYRAAGLVASDLLGPAMVRYWIGDMIGIAVLTPAILLLRQWRRPSRRVVAEASAQAAALAAALWLVFGLG